MKKIITPLFILTVVLSLLFFSCHDDNVDLIENNSISLISPNGFKIAENVHGLKTSLGLNNNEKITKVKFVENKRFNVAFVEYTTIDGLELNYAIGQGYLNFSSNKLITDNLQNKGFKRKAWKISCDGCQNCRVEGTLDPDGRMTFNCESSCCVMTVEEIRS